MYYRVSGSKESINLDYAAHLKNRILGPLVEHGSDGVKDALDVLHEYDLMREDLDSLQEICQWPNSVNTMANLEPKVSRIKMDKKLIFHTCTFYLYYLLWLTGKECVHKSLQ